MAVKTFTAGSVLTASDTNTYLANSGLVVVTPSGVTNGTLSGAKVTVGSAVASVTVSGVFSSTYDNYRVVIGGMTCSDGGTSVFLRFNNSTGSTYNYGGYWRQFSSGAGAGGTQAATSSNGCWLGLTDTTASTDCVFDIVSPYLAQRTGVTSMNVISDYATTGGGMDTNAVSQTGFIVRPASGTITGGVIMVYGYRLG